MIGDNGSYENAGFAGYYGGWSPELLAQISDAGLAVAARDCAIEVGDRLAATALSPIRLARPSVCLLYTSPSPRDRG